MKTILNSFLFIIFSHLNLPVLSQPIHDYSSTAFGFLQNLEGTEKGCNNSAVGDLKNYLKRFGFLRPQNLLSGDKANLWQSNMVSTSTTSGSGLVINDTTHNVFDNRTEAALKAFQEYYNLNITGTLNKETLTTMIKPRCSLPDKRFIGNSTNSGNATVGGPEPFRFFPGNPKWPPTKYNLTYAFVDGTPTELKYAIRESLRTWTNVTQFTFAHSDDYLGADLKISFETGDHGDNNPFDGPGGVYAHAFAPPVGVVHFDSQERWHFRKQQDTVDLFTITLHEIGHSLGLDHTPNKDSVMYPYIGFGEVKTLHPNDILGIKTLYNLTN